MPEPHANHRARYIAYESELEQLRQLRKRARGIVGKKTLADYALVRRCHFIFERASRKFPGDRRLWTRWLAFCRDSETPRQTSRVRLGILCRTIDFSQQGCLLCHSTKLRCGQLMQ